MKILIVPMAAMAETAGPSSRCRLLAEAFRQEGADVALCAAEDVNYRAVEGIPNYYLDIPMPMGLPKAIATKTFPLAQKLGIVSRKTVKSFDQVLNFTGNLDYDYLKKSVASIRDTINRFKPDIIYSEFNISAIIAARKEGIRLYTTVSLPTQYEYSHQDGLGKGVDRLLKELELPEIPSPLSLFDWADRSFCMSIRELEPIDKPGVFYCGSLKSLARKEASGKKDKILIYMGNGSISAKETLKVAGEAYKGSPYEIYIASSYLEKGSYGNVHVADRWDFDLLLPEALLFIDHGGQNSIVDGLINGVPQIVVPGKVFERRFNAQCIASANAGVFLEQDEFNADKIRALTSDILSDGEMERNAAALGRKLNEAGGIKVILNEL